MEPHHPKLNVILKLTVGLISIGLMAIGSIYLSTAMVRIIVYGGQKSAWGFEYIFCFFAPIPGFIGYAISYIKYFKNTNVSSKSFLSTLAGIVFASLTMVLVYGVMVAPHIVKEHRALNDAKSEQIYFRSALEGVVDEANIREHYKSSEFTLWGARELLFGSYKVTISTKTLPVLIELSEKNAEVQGLLASLSETPVELKLKVADSPKPQAVLPIGRNHSTPSEVLLKLATHEDYYVAEEVAGNPNAPLITRAIKQIRSCHPSPSPQDNKCKPSNDLSEETKQAWPLLANDSRERVRAWVASNMYAPLDVLQGMTEDKSALVQVWLLLNESVSEKVKQPIPGKLSAAPDKLLYDLNNTERYYVFFIAERLVKRADVTPELLDVLGELYSVYPSSPTAGVELDIAKNIKTSEKTLERLYKKGGFGITAAIINNPNTPITVLQDVIIKLQGSPLAIQAADMLKKHSTGM